MAIATEQILVELVADDASLQSAIDQLVKVGAVDQQLASSFKSTTAEINKQSQSVKNVASSTAGLTKSFDSVAGAVKNVSSGFAQSFQQGIISTLSQAGVKLEDFEQHLSALNDSDPAFAELSKSLITAIEKLKETGAALEALEASGQQGTEAFAKLEKQIDEDLVSLQKMTAQLGNLKKGTNLGSSTTSFVQLTKSLKDTTAKVNETSAALTKLKKNGGEGTAAFKELQQQLVADEKELAKITEELQALSNSEGVTLPPIIPEGSAEKIQSVRSELKGLREQIAAAIANNENFGASFEALVTRAGHLDDALSDTTNTIKRVGSDTRVFDALIEGTQAVAGGFAIAQGTAALFGDESEAMQKTLLKVNAAMAILQGLQGIQNALEKDRALALAASNIQQKINNAQIALTSALESKNVAVRIAATIAQRALNLAMAANPIGIVVVALAGLVTLMATYGRNAAEAARQTNALNVALNEGQDAVQKRADAAKLTADNLIQSLETEGAVQSKITQQEIENDKVQAQIEKENLESLRKLKANSADADLAKRRELDNKIRDLEDSQVNRQIDIRNKESELRKTTDKEALDSRVASIEAELELAKEGSAQQLALQKQLIAARTQQELQAGGLVEGQRKAITAKGQKETLDAQKAFNRAQLEQQVASVESQLLVVENGTEKELELQKKLLLAKANLDLNGAKSAAEQELIATKLHEDLLQAESDFQKARIDIRIKAIEADLVNVRAGSEEELKLRRKLLQEQAALELTNINLSADQRKAIEQKLFADLLKLSRDDIKQRTEEEIQSKIAANNIILQNREGSEAELRRIEIENIDANAQLEILAAEGNSSKIIAIKQKQAADILEINRKTAAEAAQLQFDNTVQDNQPERRRLQAILDFNKSSFSARKQAVDDLSQLDIDENIAAEHLLRQQLTNKRITQEEYNKQYKALADGRKKIDEDNAKDSVAIEKEKAKQRLEVVFASLNAISEVFTSLADAQNQKDEDRIAGMRKTLQDEIDAGAITEKQAKAREQKIEAEEKKAKIKAAERNKQLAIFNALISTAQGVASALASANIPLAIIIGALGAAQVAFIASKPIPKFKTGKKHLYEGFAEVAEDNQPEIIERQSGDRFLAKSKSIVWLGKQDKVYTHRETIKMLGDKTKNTFINKPSYVVNKEAMNHVPQPFENLNGLKDSIDNLHKTMKGKHGVTINIDKDGITEFFEKTMSEITYYNNRYTFRK